MYIKRCKQQNRALKNHNYNSFQSSSCLSIHASFCICCVFIHCLSVLKLYFIFYLLCWQLSLFRATAPVSQCSIQFSLPTPCRKNEASKEAFSSLIPTWLKDFVHIVEANNHLTLASLPINFCYAFVQPFCHDTRIKCRGISTVTDQLSLRKQPTFRDAITGFPAK